MDVVLVMVKPDGERRSFPLNREMTVIGRREDCDLRIPIGDISRKHCRLVKDDGGVRVEDLGSSNGTYRNGERVQETMLEPGDHLRVGPVHFIVQIDGVPADDEIRLPTRGEEAAAGANGAAAAEAAHEGDAQEIAADDGEFDPMSALLGEGGDSGLNIDLSAESDVQASPQDEESDEKV
jgi:predicted component of type VI protein secretion system